MIPDPLRARPVKAWIKRFVCRMLWRHNAVWHDEEDLHILMCWNCRVVERIEFDDVGSSLRAATDSLREYREEQGYGDESPFWDDTPFRKPETGPDQGAG